jgi:hypothetical protein
MKKLGILFAVMAVVSFNTAFAASKLAGACKDEVAKFHCKGKNDHAIHECLEKHEDHKDANDGFSSACHDAHEAYEGSHHMEEKGEKSEKKAE